MEDINNKCVTCFLKSLLVEAKIWDYECLTINNRKNCPGKQIMKMVSCINLMMVYL